MSPHTEITGVPIDLFINPRSFYGSRQPDIDITLLFVRLTLCEYLLCGSKFALLIGLVNVDCIVHCNYGVYTPHPIHSLTSVTSRFV